MIILVNMDAPCGGRGIPVSVLLERVGGPSAGAERHRFHPEATLKRKKPGEAEDWETGYVKNIEHEFAGAAEDILGSLNLRHLIAKPARKD